MFLLKFLKQHFENVIYYRAPERFFVSFYKYLVQTVEQNLLYNTTSGDKKKGTGDYLVITTEVFPQIQLALIRLQYDADKTCAVERKAHVQYIILKYRKKTFIHIRALFMQNWSSSSGHCDSVMLSINNMNNYLTGISDSIAPLPATKGRSSGPKKKVRNSLRFSALYAWLDKLSTGESPLFFLHMTHCSSMRTKIRKQRKRIIFKIQTESPQQNRINFTKDDA